MAWTVTSPAATTRGANWARFSIRSRTSCCSCRASFVLSFDHHPYLAQVPLWLTGTVIGRDLLLLIGIAVIRLTVGKVKVRPRVLGKIATVFQMIVVLWILLDWERDLNARWLGVWTIGAAVFTGLSGLLYVWDGVKQLGAHPASSATIKNEKNGVME